MRLLLLVLPAACSTEIPMGDHPGDSGGGDDTSSPGDDTADSGDDTADSGEPVPAGVACPPDDDTLDVIHDHLAKLLEHATWAGTNASATVWTGFIAVPALSHGWSSVSTTACTSATTGPDDCDEDLCVARECTGEGQNWQFREWLPGPKDNGSHTFQSAEMTVLWVQAANSLQVSGASSEDAADGTDWSASVAATMVGSGYTTSETFDALFADGSASLVAEGGPSGSTGRLAIGPVPIATVEADGSVVATGECP